MLENKFENNLFCALLFAKPIVDAVYELPVLREIYFVALVFFGFMACFGRRGSYFVESSGVRIFLPCAGVFFLYYFLSVVVFSGDVSSFVKIISPLFVFFLSLFVPGRSLVSAIYYSSMFNVFANFLLIPFDFSWVMWGDVLTFKGFYFFKTDLAYSLISSLLVVLLKKNFRLDFITFSVFLCVVVQVVLANSRANYFILAVVLLVWWWAASRSVVYMIKGAVLVLPVALMAYFYFALKSNDILLFDFSDGEALTQGRNVIWDVIFNDGFKKFSFLDWVFGRGIDSDAELVAMALPFREIYGAHNDYIYLTFCFGLFGFFSVVAFWFSVFRVSFSGASRVGRIVAVLGILAFSIQGASSILTSFTTKTWPLIFVLLCCLFSGDIYKNPINGLRRRER